MTATPTPEEAQRALQDVEDRQRQTMTAATSSRWYWIGSGIFIAAYGVLVDLYPKFFNTWGNTIVAVVLLVAIARSSRWGAPLFGRRLRARRTGSLTQRLSAGVVGALVVIVLTVLAISLDVPHLSSWFGVLGGLLVAAAGPWWERRALRRSARL